ncbi:MAG: thiamine-phosphate kinase [Pirellulaceae bacterium]
MEQSFVAWAKMRARRLPQVKLGIGDDAALMAMGEQYAASDIVLTADSLMDGVHFELAHTDPRRIGRKAVNVNLSDLAAMAAEPEAILLSLCLPLTLPNSTTDALAAEIFEGICEACEQNQVAIAGGDTNCWNGPLVLHVTAVGRSVDNVVWRRDGAQADDLIVVTGPLGGSIYGKHLDFSPRFDLVRKLRGVVPVHAAMDISDGLSVDLLRMCDASNCGAILQFENIPVSEALAGAPAEPDKSLVERALSDGEDFELILAIAPDQLDALTAKIGKEHAIVCGTFTSRTGLWARDGGKIRQLTSSGYLHGSR